MNRCRTDNMNGVDLTGDTGPATPQAVTLMSNVLNTE